MNNPPVEPTDMDVLAAARHHWAVLIDRVTYFPAGFGAHHWRGESPGDTGVFITWDPSNPARTPNDLENAYAAASELIGGGFRYGIAPVATIDKSFTVELKEGSLSITPWIEGYTPTWDEAEEAHHAIQMTEVVNALHSGPVPSMLPVWRPAFSKSDLSHLQEIMGQHWLSGPMGESARASIQPHLGQTVEVFDRLERLVILARERADRWVPTHGEPHFANQLITDEGIRLVDWESFRLAPPERDIGKLPPLAQAVFNPNPDMVELFGLDWTLSEIRFYADWFHSPHIGSEDDAIALNGLREELAKI